MVLRTRPATPATLFLLAAFVLLLLSVISVPITKSIALGSTKAISFGVFGYCVNSECSPVQLGYNPDDAFQTAHDISSRRLAIRQDDGSGNFSLPPSARSGLSNILVVHVIAAALTLLALVLCIVAHVRSPSHSARFLLAIFIIMILTTVLTLLSFLVDLLIFVPHFAFGTWFVLAATICNAIATILLCCGRRTLIGRKAMRRRIEENQEMSGQNYFKHEAAKEMALRNSDQSKVPQYAEFEVDKPISPDRLPLNPSSQQLLATDGNGSNRSGETGSTDDTLSTRYRGPAGPSPYGGGGYPPAVRMPRPYQPAPPVRPPSERAYSERIPTSRSNVSLNSYNRPPRSDYEVPPLPPPAAVGVERQPSSIYSDYVPPRRAWGGGAAVARGEDTYEADRYRPERPKIDTYNLDRNDRMVDNPYVAARIPADYDRPATGYGRTASPPTERAPNRASRRTSETGTMIASYYEDVDPRYDDQPEEEYRAAPVREPISPIRRNFSSNSLDAHPRNADDEYRSGPRSPAASTSSHFTSVSQRGINPRWQPQPAPQFVGDVRRKPPRNDQMNFLAGNPDFELPVSRSGNRKGIGAVSPSDAGRYPMPR